MTDPNVDQWLSVYQNMYPVFVEPKPACITCVENAAESFSPPHKPVTGGHRRHCTCERCW